MKRVICTSNGGSCYAASWELTVWQLVVWGGLQLLVVLVAALYDYFNLGAFVLMERIRRIVDARFIHIIMGSLQLVGSVFICISWIVRSGSLVSSTGSWAGESVFFLLLFICYTLRFVAAKKKLLYVLSLYALFDLLSLISGIVAVSHSTKIGKFDSVRSWLDFGFLRSYIIAAQVTIICREVHHRSFLAEIIILSFKAGCFIFFAAAVLFSMELLGEIDWEWTHVFLYRCKGSNTQYKSLDDLPSGADCSEVWSYFTAVYFMFVTVSTVGYGDFAPDTVLGRFAICVIIVVGVYYFALHTSIMVVYFQSHKYSEDHYNADSNSRHVILTGNQSFVQIKNFLREILHPDHLCNQTDDKQNTRESINKVLHVVLLLEKSHQPSFYQCIIECIDISPQARSRVHLLIGSCRNKEDLKRACLSKADAIFFLPDKNNEKGNAEDSANMFRVLNVNRYISKKTQKFAMVVNDDNRILFEKAYVPSHNIICLDEISLGLVGLNVYCRGISTLLSNLICSRSDNISKYESNDIVLNNTGQNNSVQPWLQEYIKGASNEIYSCFLKSKYCGRTFMQTAQEIHLATDGQVVLMGVQTDIGEISINPGKALLISGETRVFLIAECANSLHPFSYSTDNSDFSMQPTILSDGVDSIDSDSVDPKMKCQETNEFTLSTTTTVTTDDRASTSAKFANKDRFRNTYSFMSNTSNPLVNKLRQRALLAKFQVARNVDSTTRSKILRDQEDLQQLKTPPVIVQNCPHIVIISNLINDDTCSLMNLLNPLENALLYKMPIIIIDPNPFPYNMTKYLHEKNYRNIYHIHGSLVKNPQLIQLAGIENASSIVVLSQSSDEGTYDDLKTIFYGVLMDTMVIEKNPRCGLHNFEKFSILQLNKVENISFLEPITNNYITNGSSLDSNSKDSLYRNITLDSNANRQIRNRRRLHHEVNSDYLTWTIRKFYTAIRKACSWVLYVFFYSKSTHDSLQENDNRLGQENSLFFKDRFISGLLFPTFAADDLIAQCYFNPSINLVIRGIIENGNIHLYSIEHSDKVVTYGDLYDKLTMHNIFLPVGILRCPNSTNNATNPYVYTCPSRTIILEPTDKVYVFINEVAINQLATKLQRVVKRKFLKKY